jgi:ribosomal protein S18 acetylase RimI-like enzyme
MTRIRIREEGDVGQCVAALRTVHQASGYPANWPADPGQWLRPSRTLRAWVAATDDIPVAGHVILRQPPAGISSAEVSRLFVVPAARRQGVAAALLETAMGAAAENGLGLFLEVTDHLRAARSLYERAGFRLVSMAPAGWTTPDGRPGLPYRQGDRVLRDAPRVQRALHESFDRRHDTKRAT